MIDLKEFADGMRWQSENASGATLESDEVEFVVWMADEITRLRAQVAAAYDDAKTQAESRAVLYSEDKPHDWEDTADNMFWGLVAALDGRAPADAAAALDALLERAVKAALEDAAGKSLEHLMLVQPHDPDHPKSDLVSQGYGNAALNISAAIRAIDPAAIVAKAKAPD